MHIYDKHPELDVGIKAYQLHENATKKLINPTIPSYLPPSLLPSIDLLNVKRTKS